MQNPIFRDIIESERKRRLNEKGVRNGSGNVNLVLKRLLYEIPIFNITDIASFLSSSLFLFRKLARVFGIFKRRLDLVKSSVEVGFSIDSTLIINNEWIYILSYILNNDCKEYALIKQVTECNISGRKIRGFLGRSCLSLNIIPKVLYSKISSLSLTNKKGDFT